MENNNSFKEKYGVLSEHSSEHVSEGKDFEGIKLEEMKELLLPLREVVSKLKERIKNTEYSLIVGDDASGRVPTLILRKFIKQVYADKKDIETIFVAGSRKTLELEVKKEKVENFLKDKIKDRVLVVTELIHRGDSLLPITDVLQKLQAKYDIATIGVIKKSQLNNLEEKLGSGIIYGEQGKPSIDGDYVIAGVEKSYNDLFAQGYKMTTEERQIFLDSRSDVDVIAKKLFEYYQAIV